MSIHFSIIIPAKNEEHNIVRCLDSIGQVRWDSNQYEVIVVDNGSDDGTAGNARLKGAVVFVKPGLTISGLRNYGAARSQGDILVFLDADCTVAADWLAAAGRYLLRRDIVCFGSPPVIPDNSTWVQRAWFPVRYKQLSGSDTEWLESMNMFVRREAFQAVGGFDENLVTCEDYDFSLRIKAFGRIVSDMRIIAVHHGEASSVGHFFRKEYWRGTSNYHGVRLHGFTWRELPSLVLPVLYVTAAFLVTGGLVAGCLSANSAVPMLTIAFLAAWQMPLLCLASRKIRSSAVPAHTMQLYLLLNIYFLARSGALFQRFRVVKL